MGYISIVPIFKHHTGYSQSQQFFPCPSAFAQSRYDAYQKPHAPAYKYHFTTVRDKWMGL